MRGGGAVLGILLVSLALAATGTVPGAQANVGPTPVVIGTDTGNVPATMDPQSILVLFFPPGARLGSGGARPMQLRVDSDAPRLSFTSGEPYRLQMELFFDTYEQGTSVSQLTDQIAKLAQVQPEKHRPPICLFVWGEFQFKCVLESFNLRYTLFLDDGTPVRATMNCVWKEFSPAEEQGKGMPRH